jgi:hypothetical protein
MAALLGAAAPARAQAGFDDDRVMLQGFYWESYRHGHPDRFPFGDKHWYAIVAEQAGAIHDALFDLVWLPPPSYAGTFSAGYNPKEYFRLDNSYGSMPEHRAALEALLGAGEVLLERHDDAVLVTTVWTPPTSFASLDWISPVLVPVKNASGIDWRWAYRRSRRSCITRLPTRFVR